MTSEIIKIDANTEIKVTRFGNGKLKSRIPYVNGVKHGTPQWWWEDGQKAWEEMRKCGKQHGAETYWHANGQKKWEKMWANNVQHGVSVWWDEGGNKEREIYFIAGKEYGKIEWDEEGNVFEADFPNPVTKPNCKLKKSHQHAAKLPYI